MATAAAIGSSRSRRSRFGRNAPLSPEVSPNGLARTRVASQGLNDKEHSEDHISFEQSVRQVGTRNKWLIDPRYSTFSQIWDVVTMLALVFTAIVTPFEVSFLSAPTKWADIDTLFILNRFIDVIFSADLVLNFFMMFPMADPEQGVRWIDSRKQIVHHYLRGWFALDFFSISLMAIDFVTVGAGDDAESLQQLRALRALRALRLVKLVRMLRASRMFKRWESKIAINYAALALGRCIFGVVVMSHWFACLFALQTIFFDAPVASTPVLGLDDVYVDTWMGNYEFCTATGTREDSEDGTVPYECIDPWALYSAALYWAIMTITSIGYGDIAATPRNSCEQVITAILMLAGGFLWGQVIGTFCGVIATFDPHGAEFRRNMDDLNHFMHQKHLPPEMQRRLREYFHQTKHLQMSNAQQHLFRLMSPSLQGEVAWTANRPWLDRIPFLSHCGTEFKVELALALSAKVFAPGEVAPTGNLYVIHRGLALYGARVLTAGKVWGDDVILMNPENRSPYCARAMNYLECYTISREMIFAIANDYPRSRRVIRRFALIMALKRKLAAHREEVRKHATLSEEDSEKWGGQLELAKAKLNKGRRGSHHLLVFKSDADEAETFEGLSGMKRTPTHASVNSGGDGGGAPRMADAFGYTAMGDVASEMKDHVAATVSAQAEEMKGSHEAVKTMMAKAHHESKAHLEVVVAAMQREQEHQRAQLEEILSLLRGGGGGGGGVVAADSARSPQHQHKGGHAATAGPHAPDHHTGGGFHFHLPQLPFLHGSSASSHGKAAEHGPSPRAKHALGWLKSSSDDDAATNGDAGLEESLGEDARSLTPSISVDRNGLVQPTGIALQSPSLTSAETTGRRRRTKKGSGTLQAPSETYSDAPLSTSVDVRRV